MDADRWATWQTRALTPLPTLLAVPGPALPCPHHSCMQYVPFFANTATGGAAYTGPIDPNIPFVRPNSYKLEFAKDGSRYY